jgi:ribosome biogenesis GTPase / thiamine phosphate phosphatase
MTLKDLGFTKEISDYLVDNDLSDFVPGRVTQEHRERYIVSTGEKEHDAEITGNLRFSASSRADFPAVGDWVAMILYEPDLAIIHKVLPRKSILERLAAGSQNERQIISTNIDYALIVQSIDNNFNINRLERYLTICLDSKIEPILVISKIDLADEAQISQTRQELEKRHKDQKYILLNNFQFTESNPVFEYIKPGKTYCVIGSSGVGKSTLINNLLRRTALKTSEISHSTGKGRHTTDHRELFVLENGGIIIDTPGMKELGVTDNVEGIRTTFQDIYDLTLKCKLPGCRHENERGCAVLEALSEGVIDKDSLNNFRKITREQERFTATLAEKRKKDRDFGKMAKSIMKQKKKDKY